MTIAGGAVDLLKVDTEREEVEIILAAPAEVWFQIARVVVEYHDLTKRDQVAQHLTANGYDCRVVAAPNNENHLGLIDATNPA